MTPQDRDPLRDHAAADGMVALFATVQPPYYRIYPLARWAHIKRNGTDQIVGLVSTNQFELQELDGIEPHGIFLGYLHLPTYQSFETAGPNGQTASAFEAALQSATRRGQQLAAEMLATTPEPSPEHDEEVSE